MLTPQELIKLKTEVNAHKAHADKKKLQEFCMHCKKKYTSDNIFYYQCSKHGTHLCKDCARAPGIDCEKFFFVKGKERFAEFGCCIYEKRYIEL